MEENPLRGRRDAVVALIHGAELGQYSIIVIRHCLQLLKPTISRILVGPRKPKGGKLSCRS